MRTNLRERGLAINASEHERAIPGSAHEARSDTA